MRAVTDEEVAAFWREGVVWRALDAATRAGA
jgi:hypothetical protein